MAEIKTNPMRHLDRLGIPYDVIYYGDEALSGADVASKMGEDARCVFKSLVCVGQPRNHYVFLVPVTGELDLKKAAAAVGEKTVNMVRSSELLALTGYVHGGCSPLCTKRQMKAVVIDSTGSGFESIYFSAGKIGYQLKVSVADLPKMMDFSFADIRKPSD